MTETVFALVTGLGPLAIFVSAFLSCLALPIPTSLMMLAGGAMSATGDLALAQVAFFAWLGAVLGDQAGYAIGRWGGAPAADRLARAPSRRALLDRARRLIDRRGGLGVFLSTWAVAPLGPWVNFAAGTAGLSWARFSLADVLGEVVWVALYVGLGFLFASNVEALATLMGNLSGLLASVAVALGAAWWIRGAMRARSGRLQADRG